MSEPTAFLNGRWIPASAATISVDDAGFVLGTTVSEQLRTFGGKIFKLEQHLARLFHSLELVGVEPGMNHQEFAWIAEELVIRNYRLVPPNADLGVSILITPGKYANFAGSKSQPTVCVSTYPLPFIRWAEKYRIGQSLVITSVEQVPMQCWPPSLKCRSRMHYYLADQQAAAADPEARALLLDARGFVTEASTANVLIHRTDRGLISPPSAKILHGISLATVKELATSLDIDFTEQEITAKDVAAADEVFLTSTPSCILPVTRFNKQPISDGRPGPVFSWLINAWSKLVGIDISQQAQKQANA